MSKHLKSEVPHLRPPLILPNSGLNIELALVARTIYIVICTDL